MKSQAQCEWYNLDERRHTLIPTRKNKEKVGMYIGRFVEREFNCLEIYQVGLGYWKFQEIEKDLR